MLLNNLLFLPLDIPNPSMDILKDLDAINYDNMSEDQYRNCYHIPIMRYDKKNHWYTNL